MRSSPALPVLILLTCGLSFGGVRQAVADAPPAEPWLTTAAQTRLDLLAELAPKAAKHPYDRVLPLLQKAEEELKQSPLAQKRAAIADAFDATLLVQTQTRDHLIAARLYDSFVLAAIRFADPDPALYDGRRLLLKAAFGAYQRAGQEDRQLAVLRLLRPEAVGDANLSDWINLQFATLYAHQGQYQSAADALGAVKTPGMQGSVAFLPALKKQAEQSIAAEPPKTDSPKEAAQSAPAKPAPTKPVLAAIHHAKPVPKKRPSRR